MRPKLPLAQPIKQSSPLATVAYERERPDTVMSTVTDQLTPRSKIKARLQKKIKQSF